MANKSLIKVENLTKLFPLRSGLTAIFSADKPAVRAVDGISFEIEQGEIFCLAGESGCGKTTTAMLLTLLETPTEGRILFEGVNIASLKKKERKNFWRKVQMIFQNPYESLNPRFKVHSLLSEPLMIHDIGSSKDERKEMTAKILDDVHLHPPEKYLDRYPHELSGGERQRVAIARAMILNPRFTVADEPVSMLDVSLRAEILDLLLQLKKRLELTYLFITHDLSLARYLSDRIAIMYLGKIVEICPMEEAICNPQHPYTQCLISAVPVPDPNYKRKRVILPEREPKATIHAGNECGFYPRCPYAKSICKKKAPELRKVGSEHFVSCHMD